MATGLGNERAFRPADYSRWITSEKIGPADCFGRVGAGGFLKQRSGGVEAAHALDRGRSRKTISLSRP
jgi:hypothetical protein